MSKKILFFFLFIVFCNSIHSQNTVSGKIICQELISFPDIHIHIGKIVADSDSYGNYSAKNLPFGRTKINISYIVSLKFV